MKTQKCFTCKKVKSVNKFHKDLRAKSGYRFNCKECRDKTELHPSYKQKKNKYIHCKNGITKIIIYSPKYGKKECLIYTKNYEKVKIYSWGVIKSRGDFYVYHKFNDSLELRLHRLIMNAPKGMEVDHENHDTLNNLENNLRICTSQQNKCNQKSKGGTSIYKGVCWSNRINKWRCNTRYNNKQFHIGVFDSEIEAAEAYDYYVRKFQGEFAWLNFPDKRIA